MHIVGFLSAGWVLVAVIMVLRDAASNRIVCKVAEIAEKVCAIIAGYLSQNF